MWGCAIADRPAAVRYRSFPVTWCSFDGGHDYQPKDPGASSTWMPQAVWDFLSPL